MFGEPPQTQFDLNFSLFGTPVRVHPLFWLIAVLLGGQLGDAGAVALWVMAVFLSVLVHEMGHALAMRAAGFQPWIVLYGLGGQTSHDRGYGAAESRPIQQILISFAGPAAGFLLAGIVVLALVLGGYGPMIEWDGPWGWPLVPLLRFFPNIRILHLIDYVLLTSVFWGIFNLLPVYPLDGGQILREFFLLLSPRNGIRWSLVISMFAGAVLAVVIGVISLQNRQWLNLYVAMFFGYMAYMSYATLQAYRGVGPR